jgi:hypothetical protein
VKILHYINGLNLSPSTNQHFFGGKILQLGDYFWEEFGKIV